MPPYLHLLATLSATLFLGYGLNGILRPRAALAVFDLPPPSTATDQLLADSLITLYATRDVFMAAALYAAAWFGHRKALGWILIAGSGVAVGDGVVCRAAQVGTGGEWNHWGYAPMLAVVGGLLVAGVGR